VLRPSLNVEVFCSMRHENASLRWSSGSDGLLSGLFGKVRESAGPIPRLDQRSKGRPRRRRPRFRRRMTSLRGELFRAALHPQALAIDYSFSVGGFRTASIVSASTGLRFARSSRSSWLPQEAAARVVVLELTHHLRRHTHSRIHRRSPEQRAYSSTLTVNSMRDALPLREVDDRPIDSAPSPTSTLRTSAPAFELSPPRCRSNRCRGRRLCRSCCPRTLVESLLRRRRIRSAGRLANS